MAMTYSVLFISHQLAAVCIGTAYIVSVWVIEEGLHARWLMAAGLAAGCAPLVDYQAAFAGVPLAAYLIYKLVGRRDNRQWKHLAMAVAGSLPPILLLLAYHWTAFGSPLRTGYDASEAFAHIHQRGFLGLDAFRFEALFGSTFAPDNGLFVFSPFLLLAIPGWVLLARRKQWWHFGITLSVAFIYLAFISSLVPPFWRGGWQMGPRYITAVLPFLMVPIAVAVSAAETKWVLRSLVVGMIAAAIVIYTLSCAQFPHFPEKFHNPLYELTFRLIGDGLAPPNAGWFIGLRGFASLVPYLLLVGGLIVWIAVPSREHRRSGIAGLVVAAALIASYSLFGGGGEVADQAYEFVRSTYP